MAVTRLSGFESGSNGDALTAGNAGTSQSPITSGGTAVISTAQKMHGTRAALMTKTSTSGSLYIREPVSSTSLGQDLYIYVTAAPSGDITILGFYVGSTISLRAVLTTGRVVQLRDAADSVLWSSPALTLNTWYRVSLFGTQHASTGTCRLAVYAGDATTPIASGDSTLLTGRNTGSGAWTALRWGLQLGTGTQTATAYFDDPGYDTAATGLIPGVTVLLDTPVVELGAATYTSGPGEADGTQEVTWGAVSGAASYDAYIADGSSPAQGDFTLVEAGVTSPYTFDALGAGSYSYGIKAID